MADKSRIEWTQATWNPVTGCTKISPGCAHCYAESLTLRFKLGGPYLPGLAKIVLHDDRLDLPKTWKQPRVIFVNSMSDLFHPAVPTPFIRRVFDVMGETPRHTFQVLTKRHDRLAEIASTLPWPTNVWMGVSVENQRWAETRIPALLGTPAKTKFLSCEPLLGKLELGGYLEGLDWVIAGGESGPRARKANEDWFRGLRNQCRDAKVSFFLKQLGGHPNPRGHEQATLDGRLWRKLPTVSRAVTA